MMKSIICKKKLYLVLFLFFTLSNVFGQNVFDVKIPKFKRVCEAYGYLIGQEYALKKSKMLFPEFEISAVKAEANFNSTFGISKIGMQKYLIEILGQSKFDDFEVASTNKIISLATKQVFTKDFVINFISDVENRANGSIGSPVLQTLLFFQYIDRPQDEFDTGFVSTFKTKAHIKAKGTDWQVSVPISWKAKESNSANIVQEFTSDYGDGNQSILLMVKNIELANGNQFTNPGLNHLFSEQAKRDMTPKGGKIVSTTKMTFYNNPGIMLDIDIEGKSLDNKILIKMLNFMFIIGGKMYILQGAVATANNKDDLYLDMKKYLQLFKSVAKSIVVNDQYK